MSDRWRCQDQDVYEIAAAGSTEWSICHWGFRWNTKKDANSGTSSTSLHGMVEIESVGRCRGLMSDDAGVHHAQEHHELGKKTLLQNGPAYWNNLQQPHASRQHGIPNSKGRRSSCLQQASGDHGLTPSIDALQKRLTVAVQKEASEVVVQRSLQVQVHLCHCAASLKKDLQHTPQAILIVRLCPHPAGVHTHAHAIMGVCVWLVARGSGKGLYLEANTSQQRSRAAADQQ